MHNDPHQPRLKILVADDNIDAAESMSILLRVVGHSTEAVYDAAAAVNLAPRFQPDVVLLDIGMPRLDGYEAARQIRKLFGPNVVLVAVTGWGRDSDKQLALDAGFDHHFVKPVDFEVLSRLLAKLAARQALPETS